MISKKEAKEFTNSPEFKKLTKLLYLRIILEELKKDPNLWNTFSYEKQTEIHKIKNEYGLKYYQFDGVKN